MKLKIMSDLHFDMHQDGGVEFVDSLDAEDIDLLVIAGDMGEQDRIDMPLDMMCERFKKVVRINGNHEYYSSSKEEVEENEKRRKDSHKNYEHLDCRILEIGDKRILGATLWFSYVPMEISRDWSDFHAIQKFSSWVWEENSRARRFLEKNVREGDVVITHHLPSEKCIAPAFKNSDTNVFFVCDMEDLIREKKPALWIHGHTHTAVDRIIHSTRVICNPYGYNHNERLGYRDLVIEV